jgi:hypothetical protein
VSAVQVPAELLVELVDGYEGLAKDVSGEASDGKLWPEALDLIARVRGLLPAPAPTCPNCGHPDKHHWATDGCQTVGEQDPAELCECPLISGPIMAIVRDLLAAQADAKPAPAVVPASLYSDAELSWVHDCGHIEEFEADAPPTADTRCSRCGDPEGWGQLYVRRPLTEVLPGGAR